MTYRRIWMYAVPVLGILVLVVAVAGLLLTDPPIKSSRRDGPISLLLFCDDSLRYPVDAPDVEHEGGVAGRFQRRAGVRVEAEYGASKDLFDALIRDQKYDLVLTGDEYQVERIRRDGLVYETRRVARLVPVILVRSGNPHHVESVSDLSTSGIRLAAAGEGQGGLLGRITAEIFDKNEVNVRELENVRFRGDTVFEVARAVAMGRVDAAIVWRTAGMQYSRSTTMVAIPNESNRVSTVTAAVLNTSENREVALEFAEFLTGPAAQEIFQMYGIQTRE